MAFLHEEPTKEQERKVDTILDILGIAELQKRTFQRLSPLDQKKFFTARTLLHDPDILIFDEPTNDLDIRAAQEFVNTMALLAKYDKTILILTHNIQEIFPKVDRVILMKHGDIVMEGTKRTILTDRNLSRLFGANVEVINADQIYHTVVRLGVWGELNRPY